MLGITPLVSISERRLGLMMNSSMPRDSAREVLETSTSRSVSPICSRNSRNFLPANSTVFALSLDFRPLQWPRPDSRPHIDLTLYLRQRRHRSNRKDE